MAAVHHIGFVVTSYCIQVLYITFLTLCASFILIGVVLSDFWTFMFQHFGWKSPIRGQIFGFWGK